MLRGKVTNVTSAGVYVQTADYGTVGPCQAVLANVPEIGDMVLLSNVGDDSAPDLVVVGKVSASTKIRLVGSAAGYFIIGNAGSGHASAIEFHTGNGSTASSRRWWIGKGQAAESGSNAGSDFFISRYADDGSGLGSPVTISRATGKVTIGSVGTTAGIELGSSGPTITTGTGAPSHSAPNGSVYLRTDGTSTTTLYIRAAGVWVAK